MQPSPDQHSNVNTNSTGVVKPELYMEKYKDYGAYMQRKFDETKPTDDFRARFQARKDAKIAREKALKTEPTAAEQSLSSVLPASTASDSEDHIPAWSFRKHRLEPPDKDNQTKAAPPVPKSRTPSLSAAITVPAGNTGSLGLYSRRVLSDDASKVGGSFSRAVEPSPKSRSSSSASESLPHRRKRPSEAAVHDDCRASNPKKARNLSPAASPPLLATNTTRPTGADRKPPKWYLDLPKPDGKRGRQESGSEISLLRMKDHIKNAKIANSKKPGATLTALYKDITDGLHKLVFLPVTDKMLRKTRMLDNHDGLPQLFDNEFSGGVDWPWYIQADAEELYNKWYAEVFETDLYRGLVRGGKGTGNSADKLARDNGGHFRLMNPRQHGNGLLINGSWYPSQLAILRDGGHGASQGGITASINDGAYSVVMAGGVDPKGKPYPNEDRGDEVLYCGTDNTNAEVDAPSQDTKAMILNHSDGKPVRLFRSYNLGSKDKYAPERGFRYDGLYDVVSYEKMDAIGEKRNRHRFKLVRRDGQDPIRSEGAARRPTTQEVDEYEKDKKNRGR
jgi:hypothetical protein